MKQPKKLTKYQKQIVEAHGLDPEHWMLQTEYNDSLYLKNKKSGKYRFINKKAPVAGKR